MMNLFSVFDPVSFFESSLNWISLSLVFLFFPISYYSFMGKISVVSGKVWEYLQVIMKEISQPMSYGSVYLVISIFFFLLVSNVMGLFPFIFSVTSHPMITLSMGMVVWMGFFLMGWIKQFKKCSVHLVPEGSPFILSFIMVFIEVISHLIRPFTLSIRLAANMMAGHLIIGLLASLSKMSFMGVMFSLIFQLVLMVLEIGVGVIQSFVFSILLLLYLLDYS